MLSSNPTLAKIPNINTLQDCLLIAQEIQQNLLPKKPPVISGLDISGACVYSCMLGGDFFDYMDFVEVCCRNPGKNEIRWVRAGHEAAMYFEAESSVFHELKGEGDDITLVVVKFTE